MSSRTSFSGLTCAGRVLLDEHEVAGFGRFNHIADLAGLERERDVGQFLAQHGTLDPAPVAALAALRALRINGSHFRKRRAFLDFGQDFAGQATVLVSSAEALLRTIMRSLISSSTLKSSWCAW